MIKIKDQKRNLVAVFTGLFALVSVFGPVINTAYAAAAFNQGSQPFQLLRVGHGSDSGTTNWNNGSVDVEIGDDVSFAIFFNNTSSETADNATVSLDIDVASNGQSVDITATIDADNASAVSDSVKVYLDEDGEITSLDHKDTEQFDAKANKVGLSGNDTDVLTSGGLDIGDIDPGNANSGFVVVDFNVDGDTNGGGSGDAPDVTTKNPTNVDEDSARIWCEVDPNGENTEVWFEWGEGDSTSDLDNTTNKADLDGDDGEEEFYHNLTGLDEDTEYVYRCVAENDEGETNGSIKTFITDDNGGGGGDDLEVTTLSASSVDEDSALLRCDVDTADEDAEVWFEWGEDDDDLDEDTDETDVDSHETNERVTERITGLDEDTKYYFRCVAEDDDGEKDRGSIRSFRTDDDNGGSDDEPQVTTLAATGIDNTSATLRCEVDPGGDDTDAWFEWGTSSSNLNRDTSKEDVGSGNSDVDHSERITGLVANTTYFYRCLAENSEGDDRGSIRSFRTTTPNVITRFIDVFREVEVEPEPEVEALIITLEADGQRVGEDREIFYTASYDNRTDLTLTDVELTIEVPRELRVLDTDPSYDDEIGDDLFFDIGTVRPGEEDSFLVETELDRDVREDELIVLVAHVEYNDDGSARKIVEVIDESTYGELVGGTSNFTANILEALRDFFTSPILWLILFIALIIFVIRYLFAARKKRDAVLV